MSHRLVSVESLQVGAEELGRAILSLHREEPAPGVRGLKSWALSGRLERAGLLPEDSDATITLDDGRVLKGRALLTNSRISAGSWGVATEYEYRGTGPLEGTNDADYD
jgi:hypothetical protein